MINSIEENYHKTNSRDHYKAFNKQLQKYDPPTLMLKDKYGKSVHNNENAAIIAESYHKILNCEEPNKLLTINTDLKSEKLNP